MNKIGIIGLGYVGLPLAVEFAKKFPTVGFDINQSRVDELNSGTDATLEVEDEELISVLTKSKNLDNNGLYISTNAKDLEECNFYIVTVPTPTDKNHRPVLTPLIKASETIGKILKRGDYVIYESTVYPGVTEDVCVPILEEFSNLKFNDGFFVGYSPERINPGDKVRTLTNILKITSGSTPSAAKFINEIYSSIITAGTYQASSIKVAEAAKVIENSQRDINIAFVNELSMIFNRLDIDTKEVLEAAGTKWNFLPFRPGLVGGHCIGVDPYYLAQKAEEVGYYPEIILAGRRLNDGMGFYVANEFVKLMIKKGVNLIHAKVLLLGFTFKENCPDYRNTKVIDVYNEIKSFGVEVDVYDPWVNHDNIKKDFDISLIKSLENDTYDGIFVAVSHNEFQKLNLNELKKSDGVVYDVKGIFDKEIVDGRL